MLRRYAQHAVELALLAVAGLLAFVVFGAVAIPLVRAGAPPRLFLVLPFVGIILVGLGGVLWMDVWYPHRHDGATPAMRWFGLRVVTLGGGDPSLRDYFVRWLMMVVDGLFFGLVGAVLIAVTPRRQRLGDMVARTVVVRVGKVS